MSWIQIWWHQFIVSVVPLHHEQYNFTSVFSFINILQISFMQKCGFAMFQSTWVQSKYMISLGGQTDGRSSTARETVPSHTTMTVVAHHPPECQPISPHTAMVIIACHQPAYQPILLRINLSVDFHSSWWLSGGFNGIWYDRHMIGREAPWCLLTDRKSTDPHILQLLLSLLIKIMRLRTLQQYLSVKMSNVY